RVKQAVQAGYKWFDEHKITGRIMQREPAADGKMDTQIVDDPDAPPQWARFYDIETAQPFYVGRDGVKKTSLSEIDRERRNGYAWMRPFGQKVLERYPKWAAKHGMALAR